MKNRFLKLIKDNRGDGHIDTAFFAICMGLFMVLFLSIFTATSNKDNSHDLAEIAARQISASGAVSGSTISNLLQVAQDNRYVMKVTALDGSMSVNVPVSSAEASMESSVIQYGTSFTVTVAPITSTKIGVDANTSYTVSGGASVGGISECWTR